MDHGKEVVGCLPVEGFLCRSMLAVVACATPLLALPPVGGFWRLITQKHVAFHPTHCLCPRNAAAGVVLGYERPEAHQ
jgi:hypothetical protein